MQMSFFLGYVICKSGRPRDSKHGGDVLTFCQSQGGSLNQGSVKLVDFYLVYRVKRSPQKFPTTSSNMIKLEYKSRQQIISKNCNYATGIILTIGVADKAVNVKNISG